MPILNPYNDRDNNQITEPEQPSSKTQQAGGDDKFNHIENPFDDRNNTTLPENLQQSPFPVVSDTPILDRFWMSGIRDHAPSVKATLESKEYVEPGSVRQLGDTNNYIYRDSRDGKIKYFDAPVSNGLVNKAIEASKDFADIGRDIVRGTGAGVGFVGGGGQVSGAVTGALTGQLAGTVFDKSASLAGVKDLRSSGEYIVDQGVESLLDGVSELAMVGVSQTAIPYLKNQIKQLYNKSPQLAVNLLNRAKNAAIYIQKRGAIGDIPDQAQREEMKQWAALFQGEGIDPTYGMLTGNKADAIIEHKLLDADGSGPIMQEYARRIYDSALNRFNNIKNIYDIPDTNYTEVGMALKGDMFAQYKGVIGGQGRVYNRQVKRLKDSWESKIPEGYHVNTNRIIDHLASKLSKNNPPLEDGTIITPKGDGDAFTDFLVKEIEWLKTYAPNGRIDFRRLENHKKELGSVFSEKYNVSQKDRQDYYFALKETMKDGLDSVDPSKKLSKNFEQYNKFVTDFMDPKEGVGTKKILDTITNKYTPEDAAKYVLAGFKTRGGPAASKISEIKKYLSPVEFSYVSGLALEQLSRSSKGFSLGTLSSNWKNLSEPTKEALFGDQFPGLIKNLDEFVKVSGRIDNWIQQTNWSRSGSHINANRTPISLDPTSWLKSLGEFVARSNRKSQAHILTDKQFMNTLIEYGKVLDHTFTLQDNGIVRRVNPVDQRKIKNIMARFGVLSINDPVVADWFDSNFPTESEKFKELRN